MAGLFHFAQAMRCQSCGHENPRGSIFCQQCGARLEAQAAAVPAAAQLGGSAGDVRPCSRCGRANAPHLRFCTECGNSLQPVAASAHVAQAMSPPIVAPPSDRPPPVGTGPIGSEGVSGAGPVCWRCRGVGSPGSEVCRFCGARYADVGGATAHAAGSGTAVTAAAAPEVLATLVAVLKDGSDGTAYPIRGDQTDIGRTEGDVVLSDDPYLSPRHARILKKGETFVIRDLDSVNGVYVRIREPIDLSDGDRVLIGQQVLRFQLLAESELPLGPASIHGVLVFGTPEVPRIARLVQYTTEGVGRDVHYLYRDETVLGRENGDIVFTDDPFLSRRHAAVTIDRASRRFVLRDLGSSNGTAVALRGERALSHGDQFRVGRHLFRFDRTGGRVAR